ncbi:MAG TPA: PKD domain-containing protein [Thermoleophilaceae bacterium]|jgi:hypothetical protein
MRRSLFLLAVLAAAAAAPAEAARRAPDGRVATRAAPSIAPQGPGIRSRRATRPPLPRSARRLRAAKRAAARRYRRAERRRRRPVRRARVTVLSGLNQDGRSMAGRTPPDATGAIGPAHYVEMTNEGIDVFDRSTLAPASGATLASFAGVPATVGVGDPQVQWDAVSGRWYYLAYVDDGTTNRLAFGWSLSSDPSDLGAGDPADPGAGGWCKLLLPTGSLFPDYPKLGHDDARLVFGVNGFRDVDGDGEEDFVTAQLFTVPKPTADAPCTAPTAFAFGSEQSPLLTASGRKAFAPIPANTFDSSAVTYVVADDQLAGQIMTWHVAGPATNPTLAADGGPGVGPWSVPGNAVQPGTTRLLDTLDGRLTQAVSLADPRAGGQRAVWTQHTVDGAGGRSAVRWYELLPAAGQLRQAGTVSDPASFVFNAAISPAANGEDAAIDYNVSGATQLPAVRARARKATAPLGSLGPELGIVTSGSPYDDGLVNRSCGTGVCRWGDYAGASPDPLNPTVVWGSSQYSGGATWRSRNFALSIEPGPLARVTAAPAPALTGDTVTFDSSPSVAESGAPIVDRRWDLDGDGAFELSTGQTATASRSYSAPGTYVTRLRVADSNGDESEAAVSVPVSERPPDSAPPPPPPPATPQQPSASCVAARRKRDQLARAVRGARRKLSRTRDRRARRRLARILSDRRARYRRARARVLLRC